MNNAFRYQKVYDKGKPVHDKYDSFSIKHPPMDLSKRAKIFSPFDALKGFNEELSRAKNDTFMTFMDDNNDFTDSP